MKFERVQKATTGGRTCSRFGMPAYGAPFGMDGIPNLWERRCAMAGIPYLERSIAPELRQQVAN